MPGMRWSKSTGSYVGESEMKKRCKSCQYWESEDRTTGYCGKSEDHNMYIIEGTKPYRSVLKTNKDYYCDLYRLHENVHGPGSVF